MAQPDVVQVFASRIARYNSGMIRQQHLQLVFFPALLVSAMMLTTSVYGQAKVTEPPPTLRSVLLSQLRTTHNKAEWFVPVNAAVAGLTAEQAKWLPTNAAGKVDANANHSSGMLAYHLLFWNRNALAGLRGEKGAPVPSNNDETFNDFDAANWAKTVRELDMVLTSIEEVIEHADEAKLEKIAPTIAHISTHNAYHTGQILYVRKLQGSWNPENGVK